MWGHAYVSKVKVQDPWMPLPHNCWTSACICVSPHPPANGFDGPRPPGPFGLQKIKNKTTSRKSRAPRSLDNEEYRFAQNIKCTDVPSTMAFPAHPRTCASCATKDGDTHLADSLLRASVYACTTVACTRRPCENSGTRHPSQSLPCAYVCSSHCATHPDNGTSIKSNTSPLMATLCHSPSTHG